MFHELKTQRSFLERPVLTLDPGRLVIIEYDREDKGDDPSDEAVGGGHVVWEYELSLYLLVADSPAT